VKLKKNNFKLKSFKEFRKDLKPLPHTVKCFTQEEFCKEICPIIQQCIFNLLHSSEEEKKRRAQILQEMDDLIFEWEVKFKN